MLKPFFTIICALFVSLSCVHAQDHLHVMLSKAPLPKWVNLSKEKYLLQVTNQKRKLGMAINPDSKTALTDAVEAQYGMLASGRMLFNDEAGVLVNAIADKLLRKDTALRNSLNIVVYYNNGTEVLSYPSGLIVIELGAIAQLENEAQLAFLIAHEIAHVKNMDYATSETPFEPEEWSQEIDKYLEYKRLREIEADLLAFELYDEAGYPESQALRYFDVLERNWSVPIELPFSAAIFSVDSFAYPADHFIDLDAMSPAVDDGQYRNSTQEICSVRRRKLAEHYKLDEKSELLDATPEFKKLQSLVIYNCGLIALEKQHTAAALYAGYYIHVTDSSARDEADLLIGKAMYIFTALQSDISEDNETETSEDIKKAQKFDNLFFWANNEEEPEDDRGYIKGTALFLKQLTKIESMTLCVRWWWDYSERTTEHKELSKTVAGHSVTMLDEYWDVPLDSLSKIHVRTYRIEDAKAAADEDEDDYRIPNIRITGTGGDLEELRKDLKRRMDSIANATSERKAEIRGSLNSAPMYENTQLASLVKDSAFRKFFRVHSYSSVTMRELEHKEHAETLEADSIYLIGSHHIWTKEIKRTERFRVDGKKTEAKSDAIVTSIYGSAKGAKIKLISADESIPDTMSLDGYNNFCLARRVFSEITGYESQAFLYPLVYKEEFDSVAEATHVTHAIVDIAVTKQFKKVRQPGLFIVGCIIPYTWPVVVLWIIPTRKFTFRQTAIYNLQTGNVDYTWVKTGRSGGGSNQSGPYYSKVFKRIKKKKKKVQ